MPMTSKQKKLAALAALAALGFAGFAAAASDDTDPDPDPDPTPDPTPDPNATPCSPGFHRVPGPVINGAPTSMCVPDEPPPPPPDPKKKNYVGSGYDWPYRDRFPTEFSIASALNLLGYPVNPLASAISAATMFAVREFQRDYNDAAKAQTVDEPAVPASLSTDGLIGKNTLAAIINAQRWTNILNVDWLDIVALA